MLVTDSGNVVIVFVVWWLGEVQQDCEVNIVANFMSALCVTRFSHVAAICIPLVHVQQYLAVHKSSALTNQRLLLLLLYICRCAVRCCVYCGLVLCFSSHTSSGCVALRCARLLLCMLIYAPNTQVRMYPYYIMLLWSSSTKY